MTLQEWAIKELKKSGLYCGSLTVEARWGKAYKYYPGKPLEMIPLTTIGG